MEGHRDAYFCSTFCYVRMMCRQLPWVQHRQNALSQHWTTALLSDRRHTTVRRQRTANNSAGLNYKYFVYLLMISHCRQILAYAALRATTNRQLYIRPPINSPVFHHWSVNQYLLSALRGVPTTHFLSLLVVELSSIVESRNGAKIRNDERC